MATQPQDLQRAPARRQGGSSLSKKYAGLPLWAWGLIAGAGAFGVYYFLIRKKSSTSTAIATEVPATPATSSPRTVQGTGGGGGGGVAPSTTTTTTTPGAPSTTTTTTTPAAPAPSTTTTGTSLGTQPAPASTLSLPFVQPKAFTSGQGVSLETPTGKLTTGNVTAGTGQVASTIPTYTSTIQAIQRGQKVGYITATTNKIVPVTSVTAFKQLEHNKTGKQTTTYTY